MGDHEQHHSEQPPPDESQRASTTSPLGGRTYEATMPPGQGDLDRDMLEKSTADLLRATGGD
jgi:hypothetical protein